MAVYVNNDDLRNEILLSKERDELTTAAVNMLLKMTKKIQSKFHYDRIEDEEDCHSKAVEGWLHKWRKYDKKYDNCFSFFTQMIKNDLYAGWNELNGKRADVSISNIFLESV